MARKKRDEERSRNENKVLTILIAVLIAVIWFAVFIILIKLDAGGFGSGVLRPILKDVPVINKILPNMPEDEEVDVDELGYSSLSEAVARIKELELELNELKSSKDEEQAGYAELQAEVDRLKVFEENQLEFEKRQLEFDEEVVYAQAAPDIEEYKKYYEQINPANAEIIYRQVVEQLQYSKAITEKANIYKNMDPEAAARIMETLTADIESVAKMLLAMKPKESAAILAEMDSVVAAKITKKMLDMDEEKLSK
jgi:flagellar motility protein MotE (MotC chaperone)